MVLDYEMARPLDELDEGDRAIVVAIHESLMATGYLWDYLNHEVVSFPRGLICELCTLIIDDDSPGYRSVRILDGHGRRITVCKYTVGA